MYREIIIPTQSTYTIHLPQEMIGHEVEIIAYNKKEVTSSNPEQIEKTIEGVKKAFSPFRVSLVNWKFDRQEANNYRGYSNE